MESKLTISNNGSRGWYNENGLQHREDGPAFEGVNGFKTWRFDGWAHRLNGPAIIYKNGQTEWYIDLSIPYKPIMDNA